MRAFLKTNQVNEFVIENQPIPEIEKDEVLIKVDYCGVCGSDMHAANHAKGYEFVPKPIVLGHELSGVITKKHPDHLDDNLLHSRVVLGPANYCYQCEQCRKGKYNICSNLKNQGLHFNGGMAEYIKCKIKNIHLIPETLPNDIAVLSEPLTVALHAVNTIGSVKENSQVLVQGCGIIGLFVALAAKNQGAQVTISGLEKDWENRLRLAEECFGLKTEISGKSMEEEPFDTVFECSGAAPAAEAIFSRIKKGGKLILVALYENKVTIPMNVAVRGEINILTSYGYLPSDYQRAFMILNQYKDVLRNIVSYYPLEEGALAFEDARKQKVLKPVLKI